MFYEAKEGLAVSLDGVRVVRIGEAKHVNDEYYVLELLYIDKTIVGIDSKITRDDLLPAYRAILKLLGANTVPQETAPYETLCANCHKPAVECYCATYAPSNAPQTPPSAT